MTADIPGAIARVWKDEAAKIIGGLVRIVRDVSLAEELAQDALVAALEQWPASGMPMNPAAWLTTTARNRALNALRRAKVAQRTSEATALEAAPDEPHTAIEAAMDDDVGDDVLRLIFIACHPVLSKEARVALTLRMVGGLTTEEIARAFLSTEVTIAQRIVRAKRALGAAGVAFELPHGDELSPRLHSVLEVVYLIFNEGYAATGGQDLVRADLCDEALRLGRRLAGLAPDEPEVHGLSALMHLQASRAAARIDAAGEPVLLADQDRGQWDRALIAQGLAALGAAERLVDRLTDEPGAYQLQAAIAACHARAASAVATDWERIAALYGELARRAPSPVIELNRAVAISRARGPAAGLKLLDVLEREPALARYHLLPSARADLLEQLGRFDEARAAFERAASLAGNARQRERLEARAAACARRASS
ncbi:MAG TPA: sigma-70 family RNA polymerase sigma factor [Kofleriaceae bacterium]|nr:sigma-70 family RNA polymerase sigma factor [Kofleriaceae bacterium]